MLVFSFYFLKENYLLNIREYFSKRFHLNPRSQECVNCFYAATD